MLCVRHVLCALGLCVIAQNCAPPPWPAFIAHVVHHPNNPHSANAKARLRELICQEFSINPCVAQQTTASLSTRIHLTSDLSVHVPWAAADTALLFIIQSLQNHNTSTAADDLELSVTPLDGCTASPKRLAVGRWYPFDLESLHAATHTPLVPFKEFGLDLAKPQDEWERECVDEGMIGCQQNLLFAPQSTCLAASAIWGHLVHLQYVSNNPMAVGAAVRLAALISNRLAIPQDRLCVSRSPRPEWSACWISKIPTQSTTDTPFTGGVLSLYVPSKIWLEAMSWAVFLNPDPIGRNVSVLVHPLTGCDYIDVTRWAMYTGQPWPINTFGLCRTNKIQQPESDPRGNRCDAPKEFCDSLPVDEFVLHLLYNPIDKLAVAAKDSMIQDMGRSFTAFVRSGDLAAIEDDPYAYTKSASPFLTAQVQIRVDKSILSNVLRWVMLHRPLEIDALLLPDGSCIYHDFVTRSVRMGSAWPLNEFALRTGHVTNIFEFDSGAVDVAEEELQGKHPTVNFNEPLADSPCIQTPWNGYILYLVYNSNSGWARTAHETIVASFSEYFEVSMGDCGVLDANSKAFPIPEPVPLRLCGIREALEPFNDAFDPIVTPYANFYIPHENLTTVLSWVMENKDAGVSGYEIDVILVPAAGARCVEAYTRYAVTAGATWPINTFAFESQTESTGDGTTVSNRNTGVSPSNRRFVPRPHANSLLPTDGPS
eukprot:c17383_g1_i1.p1 GENE.c17383_g1_i1~~c17383_g1_i1.p1  ORF type:complete len:711 (+),score=124.99 c17383_g1_i1:31-2163(+)